MSNSDVQISVLMSAYNVEKYIGQAIASVLTQTFKNFELIIVNDGSTDKTRAIIDSFADERIIVLQQTNKGVAAALNAGLEIARGKYIARFDADDICYPDRLEKQYRFITSHPGYIIVGAAVDYLDKEEDYIFSFYPPESDEAIQKESEKVCPFIHSSVLYEKEKVVASGGYNIHAHTFEDHLLWLSLLKLGKGYNIQQPLLKVRLNPQSITIDEKWRTKKFHALKTNALTQGWITEKEGTELIEILQKQNTRRIKEGAYYSLLSKKYLWNNYQPAKARHNLKKVISLNGLDWKSYFFFLLSFFPATALQQLYKLLKLK